MANDDKKSASMRKTLRDALGLDKAAQQFLGFSDDTYKQIEDIKDQSTRFQAIINRENEITHGIAGASIIDFVQSAIDDPNTRNVRMGSAGRSNLNNQNTDIISQLRMSAGDISGYFQDMYSNRYIELSDIKFLAKFIPALGAAVDAIVDAISQADDKGGTLNRLIKFDSTVDADTQKRAMEEIDRIEHDLDLRKKIKNIIVKNTVVSGEYFVYAIGYAELFEQYSKDRAEAQVRSPFSQTSPLTNGKRVTSKKDLANEAYQPDIFDESASIAMEAATPFTYPIKEITEQFAADSAEADVKSNGDLEKQIRKEIEEHACTFKIIPTPVLEDVLPDVATLMEAKNMSVNDPEYVGGFQKFFGTTNVDNIPENGADGIRDLKDAGTVRYETGFDKVVNETYVRFISPRQMIPIEIMDEVIGYYYISARAKKSKATMAQTSKFAPQSVNQATTGVFSTINISEQRRTAVVDGIIQNMTEQILSKFGKKFVAVNANFKQCIADVITYNGYMDNEYHVQFIPSKYVIPFKVNEDENGHGVSCLANSIFPAKMLLSLIVSKMLLHLNNGGDTRFIYVNKGPVDTHTNNHVQRTVRNLQEQQIVMSDLLSNNLLFQKFGRNKNIVIPNSHGGKRLVEFETQDGMQVDMRTDYEDKLEQMAVLGTGVPSVIMEYVGQADFARAFENGNIKFATRVAGLAGDLEPSMTKFYSVLLENSRLGEDVKNNLRGHFEFNFGRSTSLTVTNNNELMGNIQTQIQTLQSILYGENTSDPAIEQKKQLFAQEYMRKMTSAFDWDMVDAVMKEVDLKLDPNKQKHEEAAAGGGGGAGF